MNAPRKWNPETFGALLDVAVRVALAAASGAAFLFGKVLLGVVLGAVACGLFARAWRRR